MCPHENITLVLKCQDDVHPVNITVPLAKKSRRKVWMVVGLMLVCQLMNQVNPLKRIIIMIIVTSIIMISLVVVHTRRVNRVGFKLNRLAARDWQHAGPSTIRRRASTYSRALICFNVTVQATSTELITKSTHLKSSFSSLGLK